MATTKAKKEEVVKELGAKLAKQKALVFADFKGLKVKDLSNLKKKLKSVVSEFKVAKKTLMAVAFEDQKINVDPKNMAGEIALILGYNDEVAPAKTVYEFSKTNEHIKIIGGYLNGQSLSMEEVVLLAKLPSKEQLLANLVGSLSQPMRGFAQVLNGNLRGLVIALSEIQKSKNLICNL
jgi:large subunit ribosomal protein L10